MANASRAQRIRQRIREKGLIATAGAVARRMVHEHVPARLLGFHRGFLVAMNGLSPQRIPVLGGVDSRCIAPEEFHELESASLAPRRHYDFFRTGSICAAAVSEGELGAVAWGRPGPGECVVDDSFRQGYRWRLETGEAWLHNGEARAELRGTGVYLAAFRRLLEELAARGIGRCYGRIAHDNLESLKAHRRLGLLPMAELRYIRVAMIGWYQWRSPVRNGSEWTLKRALGVRPGDFRVGEQERKELEA